MVPRSKAKKYYLGSPWKTTKKTIEDCSTIECYSIYTGDVLTQYDIDSVNK